MKIYLKTGVLFLILGVVFVILSFAFFPDVSIFAGLAGAFLGPGIVSIYKYEYWKRRPEEYGQKIENENIELHDERKEMIRGKTSRISILINWCILSVTIVLTSLLSQFEVISSEFARYVLMGIFIYWFISVVTLHFVYKYVSSKY